MKPHLTLVTNTANNSAEDRALLAPHLAAHFDLRIADPREAARRLDETDILLLRNLWPLHETKTGLAALAEAVKDSSIPAYNPPRHGVFGRDKSYLADLARENFPVIPTVLKKEDRARLGAPPRYLIKPLEGCSSEGVRIFPASELAATDISGHALQPFVEFTCEVSFFFIDNEFVYALRSENDRWNLHIWNPDAAQIGWAQQFVAWNALPYGLQRIDAGIRADGSLLLMEIEDLAPFLSLDRLAPAARQEIAEKLATSLLRRVRIS